MVFVFRLSTISSGVMADFISLSAKGLRFSFVNSVIPASRRPCSCIFVVIIDMEIQKGIDLITKTIMFISSSRR